METIGENSFHDLSLAQNPTITPPCAALTIFKSSLREMAPMKAGEAGWRWRLRFGDYFILLHFFALPAEHFGSLTDALRSRLPKGVIASALLSITMTDQGEREDAKT